MMTNFTFSGPGRILSGLLLTLFFSVTLYGQVANYTFSQSNVTYTLLTSPTTLHATNWNDEVAAVTIPFTFIFNGVGYNAASVNSNGYLTFGGSASLTTAFNPISATRAYAGAISGFGRDLINNGAAILQGIEGVTPNRIFVIQWNNARRYNGGAVSGDILNFQIRLYETSNKVEVRYGTNSASSTSDAIQGQVGLRGATNGDISNLSDLNNNNTAWAALSQGTSNDDNVNFKSTVVPASGLTFTWTPSSTPNVSATTLAGFGNVCLSAVAGPNTFTLTGSNLTGNITIGELTGFTYSTSAGGAYTSTLTLTPTSGALSQTIHVRFTPTAVQSYNGNIPLTGGGLSSAVTFATSGSGINSRPTVSANGTPGSLTPSSAVISGSTINAIGCSPVTGYGVKYSTTLNFNPVTTGTAVPGAGLVSGPGSFNTTLSGLAANTVYYYRAYATNSGGTTYSGTQGSFTTSCAIVNTFPYTMSFDLSAPCWTVSTGTYRWGYAGSSVDISAPHLGNGFIYKPYQTSTEFLYSPAMDLSSLGANQAQINVWIFRHEFTVAADQITFKINTTNSNVGATSLQSFPILAASAPTVPTSGWYNYNFDIPTSWNNAGIIYIVIEGQTTGGLSSYDIGIDQFVVEQKPAEISINSTTPGPICESSSTTLSATSSASYLYTWSPAAGLNTTTGSTVVATPASTTVYTVTGNNGTFTTTKSVTVNVKPAPTALGIAETRVSSGGVGDCDLEYVKLDAVGGTVAKTILAEDFEGTFTGWTEENYSVGGTIPNATWVVASSPYNGLQTISNGSHFAISDSDRQGFPGLSGYTLTYLNAPVIDSRNMKSLSLSFDQFFRSDNSSDYASLLVSTDNVTWTYLSTYLTTQGTPTSFKNTTIDLSAYINQPTVYLSFEYYGEYAYYWAIDNVTIAGSVQEITWSPTSGLYTDATLEVPIGTGYYSSVFAAPEVSTAYTASASIGTCSKTAATSPIIRTKKNFTGADAANPTHWSVSQNWSLNAVPTLDKCVTIPSGKSVVVNIPTAEAKSIKVGQGAKLTILKDQVLTVKETFTNAAAEGDVIIESDGSLRQLNDIITVPNSGSITARREITVKDNNQYNYLISPLIGSNLKTNLYEHQTTGVLSSSVYTLYHNEANNKFYSSTGAYIQGRSLAVKEPAASIVPAGGKINAHFIGVPMNGPFTYTLANSSTVDTGYNLIGNPYPSNIDLDKFYNLKSNKDIISATFYFWDNTVNTETIQWGNEYDGAAYAIFNAVAGGEGTGLVAGSLASNSIAGTKEPTKVVKPGQGFMVRSISPTNKTIDFSNDIRIAELGNVFFGKNGVQYAEDDRFYLKLTTPSGVVTQTATVYFDEGNTGFSQDDSEMNGTPSDVIYTFIGERKAVINGRAPFSDSDVIPIGSRHFAPGLYTIEIARKEGVFATGQNIYLRDNQTGTITNLSEGAYTFIAQAGESMGRFEIVYKPGGVLATDATVKEDVLVYRDGQDFVVKAQRDPVSSVEIFDAAGRMVRRVESNSTVERLDFSAIVNGTYILKIDQKGKITVKKVIK